MSDCTFCNIAKGIIKSDKIYDDKDFFAFLDIRPAGEGHTLIIPKKHFETIIDLNENISKKYISAIKKVGKILMERYNADGFNILMNNGKSAGQVVNHVHFHLLPRKEGDNKRGIFIG
jgi:histidine triad (HIT) family protein